MREAEEGRSQVLGQPGLHSETARPCLEREKKSERNREHDGHVVTPNPALQTVFYLAVHGRRPPCGAACLLLRMKKLYLYRICTFFSKLGCCSSSGICDNRIRPYFPA
jgi:hypothetical protein